MPRLIVLNGPPGIGKSTLARKYVEGHPLSLSLEQDVVRGLLGGWQEHPTDAGKLARELCLVMARRHLLGGRDVVVPQFVAVPAYLDRLAQVAAEERADYFECLLLADAAEAERRFLARAEDPRSAEHHRLAARFIHEAGGYLNEYVRLAEGLRERPMTVIESVSGDITGTYAHLMRALAE